MSVITQEAQPRSIDQGGLGFSWFSIRLQVVIEVEPVVKVGDPGHLRAAVTVGNPRCAITLPAPLQAVIGTPDPLVAQVQVGNPMAPQPQSQNPKVTVFETPGLQAKVR